MPSWPASLPQTPITDGFTESPAKNAIRTPMEQGPDKVRRRSTAGVRPLRCLFLMTAAQLAAFETFFNTTIASGSLSFDWTHPRTSAAITVRIVGEPQWRTADGVNWRVSVQMEILP